MIFSYFIIQNGRILSEKYPTFLAELYFLTLKLFDFEYIFLKIKCPQYKVILRKNVLLKPEKTISVF